MCLVTQAQRHRKDFMETVELDDNTIKNIKAVRAKIEELTKAISAGNEMINAILTTVINVKGLEGNWVLSADFKLIKEVESTQ